MIDDAHRVIGQDQIGDVRVSTVFLGIDVLSGLSSTYIPRRIVIYAGKTEAQMGEELRKAGLLLPAWRVDTRLEG